MYQQHNYMHSLHTYVLTINIICECCSIYYSADVNAHTHMHVWWLYMYYLVIQYLSKCKAMETDNNQDIN